MKEDTFTLRPGEEFIELNRVLKFKDVAQSGGHAKAMVADGLVQVNGEVESRTRRKLRVGDVVEAAGVRIEIKADATR